MRLLRSIALALGATLALSCASAGTSGAAVAKPVGVASVLTMLPSSNYAGEASKIKAVNAKAIRISAKWNLIQAHSPTAFDWSRTDAAVSAARAQGLAVLMVLGGPAPVWAQGPGADPLANGTPPGNPETYGTFAKHVAQRYSSYVSAWEIWNEPNLPHFLQPPTAANYFPLLKSAYTNIRSAGSGHPVISGGLSSLRDFTRDTTFLADLYSLGGKNYLDAVGIHPYTMPYGINQDPRFGDGGGAAIINQGRATMVANGDSHKSMWITEYGLPTGTSPFAVSENDQARLLVDAIKYVQTVPWISTMFLFNSQDLSPDRSNLDYNMGLYRYNGSPKPSAYAVHNLLK